MPGGVSYVAFTHVCKNTLGKLSSGSAVSQRRKLPIFCLLFPNIDLKKRIKII